MAVDDLETVRAWYILQTVNGKEAAAKRNIEQRIISLNMQDYVFQVLVPEHVVKQKKKNGEIKEVVERIFPGYIFIEMIVNEDTWYNIRNTPMITGFLGSSGGHARPVPVPNEDIIPILKQCGLKLELNIDFSVGDNVEIVSGPFAGQMGIVDKIDEDNQIVTVLIDFFGRQSPQELGFDEIKAIK